jgi:hypothetical protein
MMLLREVFSIVLLFSPAETERVHPLDRDLHLTFSHAGHTPQPGSGLHPGETIHAGGYALTLFAPLVSSRFTPRADAQLRYPTYSFQPTGEARYNRILLPLMKDAMRLVTSYIGSAARAGDEIPTTLMMVGIRG